MKKLFLIVAVPFMVTATANAQTTPAYLKKETASINKDIRIDKAKEDKMKREERQETKKLKKLGGTEVSYQSKQAFERDFGIVKLISMERLANYDEFTFTKNGETLSAFYNANSNLVGTIQDKTFADLPLKAQEFIRKEYKDYAPGDVILFDANEQDPDFSDMILFGLQFESKDSYFIEMKKPSQKIVLQVMKNGEVNYFTQLT
ncbi:MAG TPA: hypothetical protein VFI29_14930 [Hanamia sp.]|nr:hypothetical protein [Hanamia sp.]